MMKTKSTDNSTTKVTLNLRPGQLSPAQQQQWDRIWQRLIAEAKRSEAESDSHEF
jgi:hypothetical protein